MLRRESDGIFNMRTVSFMTVAVFLTVFSVAYGDWHTAKITGLAIESQEYADFYTNYVEGYNLAQDYAQDVESCLRDNQNEAGCPDYIDNCIYELNGGIDIITLDQEEADNIYGCRFLFEEIISAPVSDQNAFNTWKNSYVTPYVLTEACQGYVDNCVNDADCNGLVLLCHQSGSLGQDTCQFFENRCYVPETDNDGDVVQGSTQPPAAVVEEVSENAEAVKESANYAESVNEIVSTKPLSESDLTRYKTNLEEAKKAALEAYKQSYDASSKYSSYLLSEYQQEIAVNIATIERQLREIDKVLTTTVEERFEQQTRQAVWTLNRRETVQNSFNSLETFASSLTSIVGDSASSVQIQFPGETTGETTSGTTTSQEETATAGGGVGTEFDLRVVYPGTVSVRPEEGSAQIDIVIYNDGQYPITNCRPSALGFPWQTYNTGTWLSYVGFINPIHGPNSLGPGQNGIYEVTITPEIGVPPGSHLINFRIFCNQGQEDGFTLTVNVESQGQSGQTGQLSDPELEWLLQEYPLGSLNNDCSFLLQECSSFAPNTCGNYEQIYSCAHYQECNAFEELCVPGYIPEALFEEFMVSYVNPYYNLPGQCVADVTLCSKNSLECPEYVYSCIMGEGCDEYIAQCINTGSTQQGSSGSGSGGGSSGGGTTSTTTTAGGLTTAGTTGQSGQADPCQGDPVCHDLIQTCLTPSYIIATNLDLVDFGGFGYNAVTGEICYMGSSRVYINPVLGGRGPGRDINAFPGGSGNQPGNSGNNIVSIHFQNSFDGAKRNYVAAIVYSLNGHLTLNFMNSPDYNDLEDKIYDFIENLLYGEAGGSYITGMSLQQAEEIVNQSASVPWILWIILFVMVTCFVFFGNLLSPYNERLISSGRKALNKKDYALAVNNYNQLASSYAVDPKVKQDALEYLRQIKERLGKDKINLEFAGPNELPKIKTSTSNSHSVFSDYSRVQKMISHALHDVKKSPKMAKSRMPMISEEYKRLSPKDKERLASDYESLIYKLRNL